MTAVAEETRTARLRRGAAGRSWGWPALAGLLVLGFAVLVYSGHDTTFFYDEWDFVQLRRDWSLDSLLRPHNEHLSVLPVLLYKTLFATVGLEQYAAYRVAGVLVHLTCVALLFAYARRRVGDLLALGAALLLLFLGSGYVDILWPFQIGFLGSLAAGIGALLALDREDRRGDVVAAVLLGVALACSSIGIPLLAAALVELLGRRERGRLWVVGAPLALYAVWYVGYRSHGGSAAGGVTADNIFDTPAYVAQAAAGAAGALLGLDPDWGRILIVGIVAAVVVAAAMPLRGVGSWRLAALAVLPLAFWSLTAATRASINEPTTSRYLYPGALFLLLLAVEAARGRRATPPLLAVLAVLLLGATVANVGLLRDGARQQRDQATNVRGALAAAEAAGDALPGDFVPAPTIAPQVRLDTYRAAVADLGSPVPPASELPRDFQAARAVADEVLMRGYGIRAVPATAPSDGSAPAVEQAEQAGQGEAGGCLLASPRGDAPAISVTVPEGGLLVDPEQGTAPVQLRRWSDVGTDVSGQAAPGQPIAIRIPPDAAGVPWHARIAFTSPVRVCAVAP